MKNYFILTISILLTFSSCRKEEFPLEFNLRCSITNPMGVLIEWEQVDEHPRHEVVDRRIKGTTEWFQIVALEEDEREFYDIDMPSFLDSWMTEPIIYEYRLRSYPENNSGIPADENSNNGLMYSNIGTGYVGCEPGCWFELLAQETGGEYSVAGTSDNLVATIIDVINSHANENSDLMFLIDKTGSMGDDIDEVRNGLTDIIDILPNNCRLGLATYGDLACDSLWTSGNWFDFQNLTDDHDLIQELVDDLSTTGGCDYPESVFDGIYRCINQGFWESDNKLILVIGDAPPLIQPCTLPLTSLQPFECTEYSAMEVIELCNSSEIVANLYPILVY